MGVNSPENSNHRNFGAEVVRRKTFLKLELLDAARRRIDSQPRTAAEIIFEPAQVRRRNSGTMILVFAIWTSERPVAPVKPN
jgi:hypothetical protein